MKVLPGVFAALFMCGTIVLFSCGKKGGENENEEETVGGFKRVELKSKQLTHVQPMTGMTLWNDLAAELNSSFGKCIALEFSYIQPCKLVKGKSGGKLQYDWSYMERWKTGVCGGEISYYSSADQRNFLNPKGMYGVTWEQAAAKYHMSFVICNDAPSGSYFTSKRVTEAGLASGYRFKVISCETDGSVSRVKVTNTVVAPIYRDAYITIGGVRAGESLKGLLPGVEKTYEIKAVATTGNVSITSDFILSSQEIEFEI